MINSLEIDLMAPTDNTSVCEAKNSISETTANWNRRIESELVELRKLPQIDLPITHHFVPGVYVREGTLLKGNIYVGKAHKDRHLNVFLTGRATLVMDGKVHEIIAPCFIESAAGVMKVLYIHEDLRGGNIHANPKNITDVEKLEDEFVFPTDTFSSSEIKSAIETLKLVKETKSYETQSAT